MNAHHEMSHEEIARTRLEVLRREHRDLDEAIEALRTVYDPEIPVNIFDLGLIYELDIHKDGSARVVMTLTAPGCPVAGEMPEMVADALDQVPGIGEIEVTLTFEPPWTPEMMSEDARLALGF